MRLSDAPLIDQARIARRVEELGAQLREDFQGAPLTVAVLLKGAAWFAADLLRHLPHDTRVEFMRAQSYAGTASTGTVEFGLLPAAEAITGRDVLLVEDILDTGRTLHAARAQLQGLGAAKVKICVLLDKAAPRVEAITADYVGFRIDDEFVVGYGLDYNEEYRTLPAIYTLSINPH